MAGSGFTDLNLHYRPPPKPKSYFYASRITLLLMETHHSIRPIPRLHLPLLCVCSTTYLTLCIGKSPGELGVFVLHLGTRSGGDILEFEKDLVPFVFDAGGGRVVHSLWIEELKWYFKQCAVMMR